MVGLGGEGEGTGHRVKCVLCAPIQDRGTGPRITDSPCCKDYLQALPPEDDLPSRPRKFQLPDITTFYVTLRPDLKNLDLLALRPLRVAKVSVG